jgi:hypothetical protein
MYPQIQLAILFFAPGYFKTAFTFTSHLSIQFFLIKQKQPEKPDCQIVNAKNMKLNTNIIP